jgi:sugar O-acyltransferase (sialic acid O-acetyltransferase NeuD family)
MSRDLFIYGAGDVGRELAYCVTLDKDPETTWKVKGFIDDAAHLQGQTLNGVPVLGGFEYLMSLSGNLAVAIVDDPEVKYNLIAKIKKNNNHIIFPAIINAISVVSPFIEMGEGCIVASPHNVLSVTARLGDFVYMGGANSIGHDLLIGDYTTIHTGIIFGGGVSVGSRCLIESGAIIRPKVKIGDGSIIEAGSVVVKDIPPGVVATGVPAEVIQKVK